MDFVEFPEQNKIIAKDQPQYNPLPAYVTDNPKGEMICRVSVSPEELEQIRETGGFWMSIWTFQSPVQPLKCFTESPFRPVYSAEEMTVEILRDYLKEGSRIGNFHVGKDLHLIEIMKLQAQTEGTGPEPIDIYWKMVNPSTNDTVSTHAGKYSDLAAKLANSQYPTQWFIITP